MYKTHTNTLISICIIPDLQVTRTGVTGIGCPMLLCPGRHKRCNTIYVSGQNTNNVKLVMR